MKRAQERAGTSVEVVTADLVTALRRAMHEEVAAEVKRQLAAATTPDEYLSAQEAAQLARVSDGCVRRWIREGKLAEHRAGRVLRVCRADLEALLRGGRRSDPDDDNLTPEEEARRDLA